MVWMDLDKQNNILAKVAFSVPKKSFKKAVERNRIKRQMREAYRKNKWLLQPYHERHDTTLALLFIFTGNELPKYEEAEAKIILSLKRFQD